MGAITRVLKLPQVRGFAGDVTRTRAIAAALKWETRNQPKRSPKRGSEEEKAPVGGTPSIGSRREGTRCGKDKVHSRSADMRPRKNSSLSTQQPEKRDFRSQGRRAETRALGKKNNGKSTPTKGSARLLSVDGPDTTANFGAPSLTKKRVAAAW